MSPSPQRNSTKFLLNRLDLVFLVLAILTSIILGVVYFVLQAPADQKTFLQSIITNIIPILLIFVFSYLFIKRIEDIRHQEAIDEQLRNFKCIVESVLTEQNSQQVETIKNILVDDIATQHSFQSEVLKRVVKQTIDAAVMTNAELRKLHKAGIRRLCESYSDSEVADKMKGARKRIWFLTTMMERSFLDASKFQAAAKNGCSDFRILMLNPKSDFAEKRSKELGRGKTFVSGKINERKQNVEIIRNDTNLNLKLRHYENRPATYLIICDDYALMGFYWRGTPATEKLMLEIDLIDELGNPTLYGEIVIDEFERHWNADDKIVVYD